MFTFKGILHIYIYIHIYIYEYKYIYIDNLIHWKTTRIDQLQVLIPAWYPAAPAKPKVFSMAIKPAVLLIHVTLYLDVPGS